MYKLPGDNDSFTLGCLANLLDSSISFHFGLGKSSFKIHLGKKLGLIGEKYFFTRRLSGMSFEEEKVVYFLEKGPVCSGKMLELAKEMAEKRGIKSIVVASTRGATGAKASEVFKGCNVVVVTHSTGFSEPDLQELIEDNREKILSSGAKILTTTHAMGGIGRAVRRKFKTIQVDEIIANTLRVFGEGMKVAIEIVLMAADSGLIRTDEDVISIGKYDTAIVVRPANTQNFFDLKVKEILCKPLL